tara:strand:+ start:391 stop:627 length:237 start_codon:yes stop_codon:yes gene_type:complete
MTGPKEGTMERNRPAGKATERKISGVVEKEGRKEATVEPQGVKIDQGVGAEHLARAHSGREEGLEEGDDPHPSILHRG